MSQPKRRMQHLTVAHDYVRSHIEGLPGFLEILKLRQIFLFAGSESKIELTLTSSRHGGDASTTKRARLCSSRAFLHPFCALCINKPMLVTVLLDAKTSQGLFVCLEHREERLKLHFTFLFNQLNSLKKYPNSKTHIKRSGLSILNEISS